MNENVRALLLWIGGPPLVAAALWLLVKLADVFIRHLLKPDLAQVRDTVTVTTDLDTRLSSAEAELEKQGPIVAKVPVIEETCRGLRETATKMDTNVDQLLIELRMLTGEVGKLQGRQEAPKAPRRVVRDRRKPEDRK